MDFLPIAFLWISVFLSMIFSFIGIIKNKFWFLGMGAVLFLPFIFYFNDYPGTKIIIVLPFLHFGSAFAVYKNNKMMAWSLFSPVIFFVLFVLGIVLVNQL
jgi:hypothetical protein